MNRSSVVTGIIFVLVAIILGAFGVHALKDKLDPQQITSFEVGVRYQMYHGLALLFVGLNASRFSFSLKTYYRLILSGTLAFSLSIYLLSVDELFGMKLSFLGPITPIGGALLIVGWSVLLWKVIVSKEKE